MTAVDPIEHATPSAAGVDPEGLLALLDAFDAEPDLEPHGLIVQRHGRRVLDAHWAPHRPGQLRHVYSLSKSFTSAALAIALGEGHLGLDDLVADHLPDEAAGADERTRRMRVRHIASMSSGHDHETLLDAVVADPHDPVRAFLAMRPEQEPGSTFAYNQPPVLELRSCCIAEPDALRRSVGSGAWPCCSWIIACCAAAI